MKFFLQIFFYLFFINGYNLFAQNTLAKNNRGEIPKATLNTPYKVIKIKDGDTFVILVDNKPLSVRFAHIDCPEKSQDFGNRAKQFVAQKSFGKYVTLQHHNQYDRNGRLIAEVILEDGMNLNKELVKNGLAWHFKKYSTSKEYAALEMKAQKQKIGLWSMPHPIAPWDWRKMK